MLWLLLTIPATVMIFRELFTGYMKPDGFIEGMLSIFMWLMLTAVVFGLCCGAAAITGLAFASHPVQVSDIALVTIRDKDGVDGRFYLGSGVIKSDQYYFYYAKMPDGGFRPGRIMANDGVRVYEDKRPDAHLITFMWEVDNVWANLVAFPVNAGGYSYEFHVPAGTIRTGFTM